MSFVSDTFTGTDGTAITSHVGETGATWTQAYGSNSFAIQTNRIYPVGGASNAALFASGVCPKDDYSVTGVIRYRSGFPTIGFGARFSIINTWPSGYVAEMGAGGFFLKRWRNFAQTNLTGSPYTGLARVIGNDYTLKLVVRKNRIKLFVNGTERISVTDDFFASAGRVALTNTSGGTTTTGSHLDSLVADEFFPPSGYLYKSADDWDVADAKVKDGTFSAPSDHTYF